MADVIPLHARIADSFANFIAGLGGGNAKTAAHGYTPGYCSAAELESAYRTSTWLGKIINIPADDATREWRVWQADDLDIEDLEAEEKRLQVRQRVRQALIWERLYGGAAIIPIGLPGQPSQPLSIDRVSRGALQALTVVPRDALRCGEIIRNPLDPDYGQPSYYEINTDTGGNVRLHPSRVIRFAGRRTAQTVGAGGDGWGDSVWLHLSDSVKAADAAAAVVDALMSEAKVDVVRVKNMHQHLAHAETASAYTRRWQMVAQLKSISNMLMLDADDEWSQKQITWTGLPDVVQMLLTIMAGAADIPLTRLTGVQSKGLSNGGDIDLRNYYDMVRARQELDLGPQIAPLDEMLIRSALGDRPAEIWYSWRSLWQPSGKELADTDKVRADALKVYVDAGAVPSNVAAAMAKGAIVESGGWPGVDAAYDEAAELEPTEEEIAAETGAEDAIIQDATPRTLYVSRKVENAADIIAWAKAQGFETTLPADDLHVTIAFSRQPVDWMQAGNAWDQDDRGRMRVAPGGARMMEQFGDATVLAFASSELSWRHEQIKRDTGATWDHPEYQPHITISYSGAPALDTIKPYTGEIILGPERFEEVREDW